jgi:SAM-dependent methyltransferase
MKHNKQTYNNLSYSGTDLLFRGEEDLFRYNRWIVNKIVAHSKFDNSFKVLDYGAGIGTLALIFKSLFSITPDCIEIDPRQIKILINRGFVTYPNLRSVKRKYDLIYSSNVLEHIENDVEILKSLRSYLKEEGRLVLYLPACQSIWSSMDIRVGHFRRYEKNMLKSKLIESGFSIEHVKYCDSIGYFLSYIFRFFGNDKGEPSSLSLKIYDFVILPISMGLDFFTSSFFGKNIFIVATANSRIKK